MKAGAALEVRGACCRFGDFVAVDNVGMTVAAGDTLGLIGPNGAGKSTLLAALGGQVAISAGAILLDGAPVQGLPPHARARRGIGRTFQIPRPFRRLSVLENLLLAPMGQLGERPVAALVHGKTVIADERRETGAARALLDRLGLDGHRHAPAGTLSGGQLKLLDLARALLAAPRVLLLDEPCAGIAPLLLEVLSTVLDEARAAGTTVVIVEHNFDFVVRHCRWALVMVQGRVMTEGTPEAVRRDPAVLEAFLGVAAAGARG